MAHVLKDSMNHYAIEVKRGPKYVQCIIRLNGEVEFKTYPLTKMIVDHENNTNDGTYQFDRRWERPHEDGEEAFTDLRRVVDSFLNSEIAVTPKARRWLEALRDNPAASEPQYDPTQSTEGDDEMATKKKAKVKQAKVPKEGGKQRNGACAKVHEIATKMGKAAPRGEVIEACVKAGVNKSTASTQYQKWLHRKD